LVGLAHKEYGKATCASFRTTHEVVRWAKAKAENLTATRMVHVEGETDAEVRVVDIPPAQQWEDDRAARL
jgi:hypothetical protein